jgi:hypothetical protein
LRRNASYPSESRNSKMIFKDMDFKEICKFYRSIKPSLSPADQLVLDSLVSQIRRAYQEVRSLVRKIQKWEDENRRDFDNDDEDGQPEGV